MSLSMSTSPSKHKSTSTSPVRSPLDYAPKFSPPSPRTASPIRKPLQDRSNSQTNRSPNTTIRIVQDPGEDVYTKNPFPSQASHIFPRRHAPGYIFEHGGSGVSDTSTVANVVAKLEARNSLTSKPLQSKASLRHSASTRTSDADTLVASTFLPTSPRFSTGSTVRSTPTPDAIHKYKEFQPLEELTDATQRSTIRAVTPSTSSSAEQAQTEPTLRQKQYDVSLASASPVSARSHHILVHKRSASTSSIAQKTGNSSLALPSELPRLPQLPTRHTGIRRPVSNASTQTFSCSESSYASERPRSSSQPPTVQEARIATVETAGQIHYPVVRAASASSQRAESLSLPSISSRMQNRVHEHNWSSQLSTIASESESGSRSIGGVSQSWSGHSRTFLREVHETSGRSHVPVRRDTIDSVPSSEAISTNSPGSSIVAPLPLFSPNVSGTARDERFSDEHHDTIAPLQSPPLRMKTSGFLRRNNSDRSIVSSRPGSSQSDLSTFVANTIPAWARVYYRRGERTSISGTPESAIESSESFRIYTGQSGRTTTPSDSNFAPGIYRPRNRPHNRVYQNNTSTPDNVQGQDIHVLPPPLTCGGWAPRLIQNRRSQAELSAWKAPSFDENFGSTLFSRQNRQVVFFCLGFLCPLVWMIASFLPLPHYPEDPDEMIQAAPTQVDVEQQYIQRIAPIVDKSFRKANWWRNLNRVMSGIGTLLIGVIIVLAIFASRVS